MLTAKEHEVLDLTAAVWNAFLNLHVQHDDDVAEFRHKLHDLQRMILARPAYREISS